MPDIVCFWMEPTDRVARWLRRYVSGSSCPLPWGYHDAEYRIEDGVAIRTQRGGVTTEPMEWPHSDPRWPLVCGCGYTFVEADEWQLQYHQIYRRADTGEEYSFYEMPPGAMFRSEWHEPHGAGPDGISLSVVLPPGGHAHIWHIDGPSFKNGVQTHERGWTREGTPPLITASPSIQTSKYHGWLRGGVLSDA